MRNVVLWIESYIGDVTVVRTLDYEWEGSGDRDTPKEGKQQDTQTDLSDSRKKERTIFEFVKATFRFFDFTSAENTHEQSDQV